MDVLIPAILMCVGVMGMVLCVITIALRDAIKRLADSNEQLLLLVGMGQQGEGVARALVAKAQGPKRTALVEVEKKPEQKPEGIVMKIGA